MGHGGRRIWGLAKLYERQPKLAITVGIVAGGRAGRDCLP